MADTNPKTRQAPMAPRLVHACVIHTCTTALLGQCTRTNILSVNDFPHQLQREHRAHVRATKHAAVGVGFATTEPWFSPNLHDHVHTAAAP